MSNNKYTEEQLQAARKMYMSYQPLKKIEEATGIKFKAIQYHAGKAWNQERELAKHEIVKMFTDRKKSLMSQIAASGLEILAKAMEDIKNSDRPLTPKEATAIAGIVGDLDKIAKLDEGSPTEILAEIKPASTIEIKKLLKNDPFMEIEDAEIREVPEEEKNLQKEDSNKSS